MPKFHGENFRGWLTNCEIREGFPPRIFPAIYGIQIQFICFVWLQDFNTFNTKIRKLYSEQMGPLCAASLEQGSYQRGYDYIVR